MVAVLGGDDGQVSEFCSGEKGVRIGEGLEIGGSEWCDEIGARRVWVGSGDDLVVMRSIGHQAGVGAPPGAAADDSDF